MGDSETTYRVIDQHAIRIPKESGLLPCLYVPIAARDQRAIETYVGSVVMSLAPDGSAKALLMHAHYPGKRE